MEFTQEEFDYLQSLADQGLQDQADAATRNEQIAVDQAIAEAKAAKLADLQAQADALIAQGLADFETNDVPTITAQTEANLATPKTEENSGT